AQKIIIFDKEINKEQIKKAESILEELKQGVDFAELANKYSEDPGNYPKNGGDLGWIAKGQMVPEFEKAAFALEQGKLSEIIITKFGFHIIKLEEKQSNRIHARHILIKPYNFNQWLEQKIAEEKIWKLSLDLL
ncbi:MAG: peptidylprolyl isomerase, partial [Patescibacteria group bacterium]